MQPQLVLVDQPVRQQRLGQTRTAHDEDRPSGLTLEPGNLGRDIPDHGRAFPVGPLQRRRGDVLGELIQRTGDQVAFVRHRWPVGRPNLIGHTPE